jgi:putative hydrolase of the HAD superfamily
LPRYAAVIFDMDDTLISRSGAFQSYLERFHTEHPALHDRPREAALQVMSDWDSGGETDRTIYFSKVKAEWPDIPESAEKLANQFWAQLPEGVEPYPGAIEVLKQLNQVGVPWGILTNGPSKMQRRKTVVVELDSLAPFILIPSEFDDQKPSPAVFQKAIEETGTPASQTLFVGDNPITDIGGAQSIGMPTAWMKAGRSGWTSDSPEPDHVVDHIRDLVEFLI